MLCDLLIFHCCTIVFATLCKVYTWIMTAALNNCQGTEFHSCRFVIVPSTAFYYLPVKSLTAVSDSIIILLRGKCLVVYVMHVHAYMYNWLIVYPFCFFVCRLQTIMNAVSTFLHSQNCNCLVCKLWYPINYHHMWTVMLFNVWSLKWIQSTIIGHVLLRPASLNVVESHSILLELELHCMYICLN